MRHTRLTVLVAGWLVLGMAQEVLVAQQGDDAPGGGDKGIVKFEHLSVDMGKRTITIDAEVCLREGQLELLLCKWDTKTHESILHTKATASKLHGALLLLGLMPGKPAEWVMSDNDDKGRFIPPRGGGVTISIRWRDNAGNVHQVSAVDMLKVEGKARRPEAWVFVGSDVSPAGRYWADDEGGIISVANFASAVIDVPFESSDQSQLLSFSANTPAIPALKTAVEVLITPVSGAEKAPHARATLMIGPQGQFDIDGQEVLPDKLVDWAQQFTSAHSKGQVVIKPHPRSLAADIARARTQLRIGGVYYFDHRWYEGIGATPPRIKSQAAAAMAEWRRQFASPRDYIHDPGEQAREELTRLGAEILELQRRRKLIEQHAENLRKALADYKPPSPDVPDGL